MANKRYYYLKISSEFFNDKAIKRLRRLPGGDTYTIVYLKMLLSSLETDGYIVYESVEDNPIEEIALDIDEDVEAVEITMNYLVKKGLASYMNENIELTRVHELSGSETASTRRSRKCRALQFDTEMLQCNTNATPLQHDATKCNVIQETETEKELETDIETETKTETEQETKYGQSVGQSLSGNVIPSLSEVREYIQEKGYRVDPNKFYKCYEETNWRIKNEPIKNWKAVVRGWDEKRPIEAVVLDEKFYERKVEQSADEVQAETAKLQQMLRDGTL